MSDAHGTYICSCDNDWSHKYKELSIVSFANASSKPHTMMIESSNTVVTDVTVGAIWWSENGAGFTVLHSRDVESIARQIIYPMSFMTDCDISPIHCFLSLTTKVSGWYNTWVLGRSSKKQKRHYHLNYDAYCHYSWFIAPLFILKWALNRNLTWLTIATRPLKRLNGTLIRQNVTAIAAGYCLMF